MVGRTRAGAPLVPLVPDPIAGIGPEPEDIAANQFTYAADPDGVALPVRRPCPARQPAHRRSARRAAGPDRRLLRMLGFKRAGVPRRPGRVDALPPPAAPRAQVRHCAVPAGRPAARAGGGARACISSASSPTSRASSSSCRTPGWRARSSTASRTRAIRCSATASRFPAAAATDRFSLPQRRRPAAAHRRDAAVRHGARRRLLLPAGHPRAALHRRGRRHDGARLSARPGARGAGGAVGDPPRGPGSVLHVERRLEPFFRRRPQPRAARAGGTTAPVPDQPQAPGRGPEARRGADRPRRGGEPRLDHRELRRIHAAHLSAGQLRARRQHQDPRLVRAEVVIRDGLPAHLRRGIFAEPRTFPAYVRFSGPGPNLPNDIEDVGFGSMAVKLMDVPGPEADGRREVHPGPDRGLHADLRHPEHARERQAADLELPRHAGVLFPEPARLAPARLRDAVAVERDAVQPASHPLLELRPLPARARGRR